jgi:acetyl-CoA/propionyl-CoA carboxylase biotin carboxyl carrier protein
VLLLSEPADARVDSGITEGSVVGSSYDPMLAKVIVHAPDRGTALRRLDRALGSYTLLGVGTNTSYLRALLTHPDVIAGRLDTGLVERADLRTVNQHAWVLATAASERLRALRPVGNADPWDLADGWRLGGAAWTTWRLTVNGGPAVKVSIKGTEVRLDDEPVPAGIRTAPYETVWDGGTLWIGRDGDAWAVREEERALGGGSAAAAGGVLRSPMPGTVLAVKVTEGDTVEEGQPIVIVEAMKMEHTVTAAIAGTVSRIPVRAGNQVALDAVLAEITPEEDS